MNEKELARAVARDLGPDVAAETDSELAGKVSRDGRRAFSTDQATATAGFVVQASAHAFRLWDHQQDRESLLAALAEGVEQLPELSSRLHPEVRLKLIAKVIDKLIPEQSSRSLFNDSRQERRRWMQGWLEDGRKLSAPPILLAFADMDYFALYHPLFWERPRFARLDIPYRLTVPKGFVTDLATVPRLFWQVLPPQGRYGPAAILHDWLYWHQATTREVADHVFLAVMEELGVSVPIRRSMWAAVRVFGGQFWDQNMQERRNGGRRVLRQLPSDIMTTWLAWRERTDVFEVDPIRRFA